MKIAVTGASGMLGDACIRRFVERGDEIFALVRKPFDKEYSGPGSVTQQVTNFSQADLKTCLKQVDAIVHLAAMRPNLEADTLGFQPYFEANVKTTENILRVASELGIQRFCQASSISVYSSFNSVPFRETDFPVALNFYGASKIACEQMAMLYAKQNAMRTISLRIAQILGNDQLQSGKMLMKFMSMARTKEALPLWGEGRDARDTVYIKDVVTAIEASIDNNEANGIFNIGGGRAITNREVAESINLVFGNEGNLFFDRTHQESDREFYMDCSRAESELGWKRQWTLLSAIQDLC